MKETIYEEIKKAILNGNISKSIDLCEENGIQRSEWLRIMEKCKKNYKCTKTYETCKPLKRSF